MKIEDWEKRRVGRTDQETRPVSSLNNVKPRQPGTRPSCPSCGATDTSVLDSRPGEIFGRTTVRRRRGCVACNHRWSTFEMSEDQINELVELAKNHHKSHLDRLINMLMQERMK